MEQYYDRGCGRTNFKFSAFRKAKRGALYLCGDKLGIFTNVVGLTYMLSKLVI